MLKLYSTPASPFAARVRIQVYKKDLPVEIVVPPGEFGSNALRDINPLAKIPVLETGELKIIESEVIQEYLQEKFPSPSMLGTSAEETASIRSLSRIVDIYLVPALMPVRAAMKQENIDLVQLEEVMEKLRQIFAVVDTLITGKEYAISSSLSLADCSMIPIFYYLEFFTRAIKVDLGLDAYKSLHGWRRGIENDPAVMRVLTEIQHALDK